MSHLTGITLIEILISFTILSLMLLGLDAMQITSLHSAKSAYYYSVAEQQLHIMARQLQVIDDNDKQTALAKWNAQNQIVLPNGRGMISGYAPHYRLSIHWGQKECLRMQVIE